MSRNRSHTVRQRVNGGRPEGAVVPTRLLLVAVLGVTILLQLAALSGDVADAPLRGFIDVITIAASSAAIALVVRRGPWAQLVGAVVAAVAAIWFGLR